MKDIGSIVSPFTRNPVMALLRPGHLPIKPDSWESTYTLQDGDKGEAQEISITHTLEDYTLTEDVLRDIPGLAGFHLKKYTHAGGTVVVNTGAEPSDPDTGPVWKPEIVVPSREALRFLWDKYQLNVFSLHAFSDTPAPYYCNSLWAIRRNESDLILRAFGLQLDDRTHTPFRLVPDEKETQEYVSLRGLVALSAAMELHNEGEYPVTGRMALPNNSSVIYFPPVGEAEEAGVGFPDKYNAPATQYPFKGMPKGISDKLAQAFRIRKEIAETSNGLQDDSNLNERSAIRQIVTAKVRELEGLYIELSDWVAKHKEPVLKTERERERTHIQVQESRSALAEKRDSFIQLASNIEGLPAHFAALPSGIADGMELETDQFGKAILRIRRAALDIPGQPVKEAPRNLLLPLHGETSEEGKVLEQAKLILGENGPRWLMPQGMVAVSKLYRMGGGYARPGAEYRLYLNDWIDTMRPAQLEAFKKKGRGEAFGQNRNPKDLFDALLGVLNRLSFERIPGDGSKDVIDGFFTILGHGNDSPTGDNRGYYVDIMLNPKQLQLVAGERPMYMVTNAEAMLNYKPQSLDYVPAAQLALELLARQNLYNRDTSTISTPSGDGITRLALAGKFGLLKGRSDKARDLLRRLNTILDTLGDAGIIESWKPDGRDKEGADAFGVKLHLTMHDDYRKAYNLTKQENQLNKLERQLQNPFAPPKKGKSATIEQETPVKRGRGRPRKKAA